MTNQRNNSWIPLINPIVTILVCVFFQIVYSRWGQVQPESTIDSNHETTQLMAMENVIMDLINENEKYKTKLDDISSKLMILYKAVDNLNKEFGELNNSFKTTPESNTGALEEMRRKIASNSNKLSENREQTEQVKTDISAITINLEETRIDLEEKLRQQDNNGKKTIQEINEEVSKIRQEMDDKIKKIEEMNSTLIKTENAKKMLQDDLDKLEDMVNFLRGHAFNKSVMLIHVAFLTVAVFVLIIGMWNIWNRVSFDHHGNTPKDGSGINPRMSVIERVPNNPLLTNTICVISYGQMNESFNRTLVDGLMRQLSQPLQDTPVRRHLINSHADIANIPHCKLIFMCVEFSSRHVIIEEPGIGQGDIRRTTYDAVRKLGATLVILYTRDRDSRQLRDGLRYQSNIYCVTSQPELGVLDDRNCFYSVFDSFTPFQVEKLKDVIWNALQ